MKRFMKWFIMAAMVAVIIPMADLAQRRYGVNKRQYFKQQRIRQGVRNGELTAVEAAGDFVGTEVAAAEALQTPAPTPVEERYENQRDEVGLLTSYYNAINRREYERAYSYWFSPPSDYEKFAQGYRDTTRVQLLVQPPGFSEGAAGSTYVSFPVMLIARQRDGGERLFAGYYVVRTSNEPRVKWRIDSAKLQSVSDTTGLAKLFADLEPDYKMIVGEEEKYEVTNNPVGLLASYFDAVKRQEYRRAYGYWRTPPRNYEEFELGYQNTFSVRLFVPSQRVVKDAGGSASTSIPVALIARQRDGGERLFTGCYTVSALNTQQEPKDWLWAVDSAKLKPVSNNGMIPKAFAQACQD